MRDDLRDLRENQQIAKYGQPIVVASFIGAASAYFGWSGSNDYNFLDERSELERFYFFFHNSLFRTATPVPSSSNLACFFCSQLLSVTKHRVGLSQNQLRAVLHDKCRVLPIVLKEQCFAFVETSLPEIYFSLNYDFSTKDICVRLSLCEEDNPFAVAGTPPEDPSTTSTASPRVGGDEHSAETTTSGIHRKKARQDRADRKNTDQNSKNEEKRITCAFCERMLENAKNYAVTAKVIIDRIEHILVVRTRYATDPPAKVLLVQADINSFASTACSKLPKGRYSDHCHQLADKKIAELAKFVDQQVIEALWCAELNQC
ncbi:surfactant protein B [Necator americanus]|uniref:Surfactant protein B n=1 Tax=Necator americanus TaxID=51031 RepID=W2TE19_NECAM|nr:surfactant protein B [Necator americanus]ETN80093.1 surfactant protein B [Necator americanus]